MYENVTNSALPFEKQDGRYLPKQCEMYSFPHGSLHSGSNVSSENITSCQYGIVYNYEDLFPTISTELDWVCEDDRVPYWVQTFFYIGTSIGSIIFGHIADRFGRRPSIVLSYAVASVAGVSSAFVSTPYPFAFLRFLVGACIIPLSEDPYVLSLEYIGVEKRTLGIIIWASGYILFSAICPWIAYGLKDWRLLCIVTHVPLALVVLCGMFIPESASWLLTQGRKAHAVQILKTVAKVNGREIPAEFEDVDNMKIAEDQTELNISVLNLFKTPRLRKNSVILAITWFVVYCCYHINTQNASNLGTNIYQSFTYGALVEIPAQLIILFGIDWIGRRWPMVICAFLAGIAGLFTLCIPVGSAETYLVLALAQRVTLTVIYNIIIQYSAELFPTVLRGRGLAFLRFVGTLGLYLSPSIVYMGTDNISYPLVIPGIMILFISIICVFLPETLHHHMPHTILDGENFGKDQSIFDCPCVQKKNVSIELEEEPTSAL